MVIVWFKLDIFYFPLMIGIKREAKILIHSGIRQEICHTIYATGNIKLLSLFRFYSSSFTIPFGRYYAPWYSHYRYTWKFKNITHPILLYPCKTDNLDSIIKLLESIIIQYCVWIDFVMLYMVNGFTTEVKYYINDLYIHICYSYIYTYIYIYIYINKLLTII